MATPYATPVDALMLTTPGAEELQVPPVTVVESVEDVLRQIWLAPEIVPADGGPFTVIVS